MCVCVYVCMYIYLYVCTVAYLGGGHSAMAPPFGFQKFVFNLVFLVFNFVFMLKVDYAPPSPFN